MHITNLVKEILVLYSIDYEEEASPSITYGDVIYYLLATPSTKDASIYLDISVSKLERLLNLVVSPRLAKVKTLSWKAFLLSLIGKKYCPDCDSILDSSSFYNPKRSICYVCDRDRCSSYRKEHLKEFAARNAKYKAATLQRTPSWANLNKIKEIYRTCPEDYHVDHIVPLQGELVSGLHVEYNLQHLPAFDNISKGNKFKP